MNNTELYDTIIIGTGIAGLFYGYKYQKYNEKFKILEKNDYIGGRVKMGFFHKKHIVYGAGVGRYDKDILLKKLLTELDIPIKKTKNIKNYMGFSYNEDEIKHFITEIILYLKKYHKQNPRYMGSFKDIMLKLFDEQIFEKFVELNGYGDFVNEDFRETIQHYGIEDNIYPMNIFSVPWDLLVNKLVSVINRKNIETNCKVIKLCKLKNGTFQIDTYNNKKWFTKKIVFATEITTIHKFFPNNILYNYICSQPFSRIYVKFDKKSSKILEKYIKGYTIVSGPLQKIIPISQKEGIYMIGYNDNENSKLTKNMSNHSLEILIKKIIGEKIHILDSKIIFWKNGTHYFKPYFWNIYEWKNYLNQMQNPDTNVKVVGEAFSFNQGWVEGALESVMNVL